MNMLDKLSKTSTTALLTMTTQYTHTTHDQNQSPVQQYHDLQSGHGYIISVSHSPNHAELRTLSNVELEGTACYTGFTSS